MGALLKIGAAIDKAVGLFAPSAAYRRLHTRAALHRAYEAASPLDPWRPKRAKASADADHSADASMMRDKARALVQNVPYIAQGIRARVNNTIGTGISTRSVSKDAEKIEKLWMEWQAQCDSDSTRFVWPAFQAAAYRAVLQDGECLIRLRPRRIEDGLAAPLQLQLLEIDWLDGTKQETTRGGGAIVNGIQYNIVGAVEGYWLYDQHPGDMTGFRGLKNASRFIPANRIIHVFNPDRPGQGRGFTALASIIARVRDMMLFEDAELARKNTESRLSVLVSGNIEALRSDDTTSSTSDRDLGTLGSNTIIGLPEGSSITTVEPKASGGYVEYLRFNLHLVAAGLGVTYSMLTGDVTQANYSSSRVGLLEFRRNAEAEQWNFLVPNLVEPVWKAFVQAAYDAGKISSMDAACEHSTPRWEYIDPKDDAASDQLQIATGLTTLSETWRRRGYKPEAMFLEIKKDLDRLRADGSLETLMMLQARQAPQAKQAPAPAPEKRSEPDAMRNIADAFARAAESAQATATAHNTETAATMRQALAMMAPAPVHIHPQAITVEGARVEVTTPPVEVRTEAPIITVQPAEVRVSVDAIMPTTTTETTLHHNADGELIGSTQKQVANG